MSKFDNMNDSLRVLRDQAIITDFESHLEIRVTTNESWSYLTSLSLLPSNISMHVPKPVHFTTEDRSRSVWWTNGIRYNPYGPCVLWREKGSCMTRYTDEQGHLHREDGPAYVEDGEGEYREEWKISPGVYHRVGGPALIQINYPDLRTISWGEFKNPSHNDDGKYCPWHENKFDGRQEVQYHQSSTKTWCRNGRPYRENGLPDAIQDTGIYTVSMISPLLIPTKATFIRERTYSWHNEKGRLDRTNGPAVVRVYNLVMEEEGTRKKSLTYSSYNNFWHHNGASIEWVSLMDWFKEQGIEIIDRPPVERRAFNCDEDEFCFVTDFLPGVDVPEYPF